VSVANQQGLMNRVHAVRLAMGELHRWLTGKPLQPIPDELVTSLRTQTSELTLRLDKLEAEPSMLTVVLLGGTGVGKSTILNALAGSRIASSGIQRPTTQYSTVYHHESIHVEALPEPFRQCRSVAHQREELRYKILIDTPDMDGSVVEHHDRLKQILPVADAVLYVGSAEKYHDRAVWDVMKEHAQSRAFAFLLNKWDRCLASLDESTGRPPDQDLRRSLEEAGFASPFLFRLCARQWEAKQSGAGAGVPLVEDDFLTLQNWLTEELDSRTIQDIKAKGISSELDKAVGLIEKVIPPDWSKKSELLAGPWSETIRESVADHTDLLLEAADNQSADLERHFGRLGRLKVGGLFGIYLHLADRLMHLRGSLLTLPGTQAETEMSRIASKCVEAIPTNIQSDHREAMIDRLLSLASRQEWAVDPLREELDVSTRRSGGTNDAVLADIMTRELRTLERDYVDPRGSKRAIHTLVRQLCQWLPIAVLVVIGLSMIYAFVSSFRVWGVGEFFSALLLFAMTIAGLHFLMIWVFPVHWGSLREKLRLRLSDGLFAHVSPGYLQSLDRYTKRATEERNLLLSVQKVLVGVRDQLRVAMERDVSRLFARKK
jgi:energy-coupling factor transporter ATP-binding protein EcfA2